MSNHNTRIYRLVEENSQKFYQLPKELMTSALYKDMSINAKVLYALLLDRKELSRKNGWVDNDGYVYLVYTRESVAETLGISKRTAIRAFKELNEANLIIEKSQGMNQPNKIYVCKIEYVKESCGANMSPPVVQNCHPNDTDLSETENNKSCKQDHVPLDDLSTITKMSDQTMTAYVILTYANEYEKQFHKKHPRLKENQIQDVIDKIEFVSDNEFIDLFEWKKVIQLHFGSSCGDGNINRFICGDEVPFVIYNLLDEL